VRPVVYSASSLNTYTDCHLKWYFTYVTLEPSETTEAQAVGIAVHDYAEATLKKDEVSLLTIAKTFQKPELLFLYEVFDRDILPTYEKPVLIEAPFQLEINGIPFSGIIDAVDEHAMEAGDPLNILRDLKTTGQRPSKGKYRLNMTGYWLGAESLGFRPDAAKLDYIVRTRKPYYWPEVMDPITEDDVDILAATLTTVHNGVESGDYSPTGLGTTACSYCGYKAVCGPYQRYLEVTNPIRKEARVTPADMGLTSSLEKPR